MTRIQASSLLGKWNRRKTIPIGVPLVGFAPLRRMRSVSPLDTGLPRPAMVPLLPSCTTSATCSSSYPPSSPCGLPGNAHGVSWCLQGFSLTRIVHRYRLTPLLTFCRRHVSAVPVRLQGLVPRASPLPPTKGRGPIPSWRFCFSRVSLPGHHTAVLPRPRVPSTTFSRSAFPSRAEARPTTC